MKIVTKMQQIALQIWKKLSNDWEWLANLIVSSGVIKVLDLGWEKKMSN